MTLPLLRIRSGRMSGQIGKGHPEVCMTMGDGADTGGMTGGRWAIAAEPLRIGVTWVCQCGLKLQAGR